LTSPVGGFKPFGTFSSGTFGQKKNSLNHIFGSSANKHDEYLLVQMSQAHQKTPLLTSTKMKNLNKYGDQNSRRKPPLTKMSSSGISSANSSAGFRGDTIHLKKEQFVNR
jgi:hypothetical protein